MEVKYKTLKNFDVDERNFQVVAFDIDGTLAKSKLPLSKEMLKTLAKLLKYKQVAILSGGDFARYKVQILKDFDFAKDVYKNLFLFPANATSFYVYNKTWNKIYEDDFSVPEKRKIFEAVRKALKIANFPIPKKKFGKTIEDRGSEITFSFLGMRAPIKEKLAWDPTHNKKQVLQKLVSRLLPDFSVKVGGTTSLDITKKGIDKAYGLKYLAKYLKIDKKKILYVGDSLFSGGNDEVVLKLGLHAVEVKNEIETRKLLQEIILNILRNKMRELSPTTDLRPWGMMREFEFNKKVSTKLLQVKNGEQLSLQSHQKRGEFWRIVKGNPIVIIGNDKFWAKVGDEFVLKPKILHQVVALRNDCEILEISYGKFDEKDIERYKDKYGRK